MLEQIQGDGFASVTLTSEEAGHLRRLYDESLRFFGPGPERNVRYSNGKLTNGYRPPRSAYNNGDPVNEADTNDSFLYWSREFAEKIPHCDEIRAFLGYLESYRSRVACRVMADLIMELSEFYRYEHLITFENASVLQVNSFGEPAERVLSQTPHEDGVLATVIWTSAPGLGAALLE
jgi:hypothetical protein